MKEYTFKEEKIESCYRYLQERNYRYFEEYAVEVRIDNLTRNEVEEIRNFIKEISTRESAESQDEP